MLGHVRAEQSELAALANERPRQWPIVRLELVEVGQHLVVDELVRGLRDDAVFVRQHLRREDRCRLIVEQPRAALSCCVFRVHLVFLQVLACHYIRSKMPAAPIPPPTHMVTMP